MGSWLAFFMLILITPWSVVGTTYITIHLVQMKHFFKIFSKIQKRLLTKFMENIDDIYSCY